VPKDTQRTVTTTDQALDHLPERVTVAVAELASAAREGLLALAVGTGLQVLQAMLAEDVARLVGAKGRLDLARDIEIEVVLGQLGSELTQRFMAELEFWDPERELVLAGSDTTQQLAAAGATPVLRLAYHGRWDESEERGEHWVAFAKNSDPDADQFTRVPRADRAVLPFLFPSPGRPLALTAQGQFRQLLEQRGRDNIAQALRDMVAGVEELSAKGSLLTRARSG
jgi:hypothetical protein